MSESDPSPLPLAQASGSDDRDLLREYVATGSQAAFAALVRRRIGLVYSIALSQTRGDRPCAEDVAQAVFTDLARKARTLVDRPTLAGWLFRSAQVTAAARARAEYRRRRREQEAYHMNELFPEDPRDADWQRVRPLLEEALSEIDESDRDAILLRFFDGRPFAEIGERLRLNENTARMRVTRALEQVQTVLARRGITSSAVALGAALAHSAAATPPAGLVATVTGAALAARATGIAGGGSAFAGVGSLSCGVAAFVLVGAGLYVWQGYEVAAREAELAALSGPQQSAAALREENRGLARSAAEADLLRAAAAERQQLTQQLADLRQAAIERDRLAAKQRTQARDHAAVQAEIDRMNREGNTLVLEYKALQKQASDPSLSAADREAAEAASRAKLAEIQAKKREIEAYIASMSAAGRLPAAQASLTHIGNEVARRHALRAGLSPKDGRSGAPVSVHLPGVDLAAAIATLERLGGPRIVCAPEIEQTPIRIDFHAEKMSQQDAAAALRQALETQGRLELRPLADGRLFARPAAP